MKNKIIKIALLEHNLKQWELAELMNTTESVLSRRLRKELPESEQREIVSLIEEATK